ncbi:uncharacterized protein LOC121741485 [Salvia splendens]|uniref:uncharacterized protein LOC121741485 n=1 Tax=Salvia splendens TaxID=180675 RepID=UPI001C252792|nr:uncharacterized protein LOC121741485 [Salvia splendens]
MAFDCNTNHRKPLLFSDLFKNHYPNEKHHMITPSASSPSSNSTQFLSSWDSSSSGFSTPLRSDFASSDGDDSDFIAELTRQMAERMLDDEEDPAESVVQTKANDYKNCGAETELNEPTQPNIQVYELKNQAPVRKERRRGRRVRRSESAQPKQLQKTEQQYRGSLEWGGVGINGYSGSGMQAVFLGGSGPRLGYTGTGVFLPRDLTELKNKPGCSMVLMPTRVLQVLEKHFSSRIQQDSNGPPLGGGPLTDESTESNGLELGSSPELEIRPPDISEVQLPQEWTY